MTKYKLMFTFRNGRILEKIVESKASITEAMNSFEIRHSMVSLEVFRVKDGKQLHHLKKDIDSNDDI